MVVATSNMKKINTLVNVYYDIQQVRIIAGNRFFAAVRDDWMTEEEAKAEYKRVEDSLKRYEKDITKDIGDFAYGHPIWIDWLSRVRGIGPIISGGLLSNIMDISRFDTVSKLWAYAGLAVRPAEIGTGKRWFPTEEEAKAWSEKFVDRARAKSEARMEAEAKDKEEGKDESEDENEGENGSANGGKKKAKAKKFTDWHAQKLRGKILKGVCWGDEIETEMAAAKRRRGQIANWNAVLRTLCWKIGESFNKVSGPYQRVLHAFKEQDRLKHPDTVKTDKLDRNGKAVYKYTKGHIHNRGKRRTAKLFLSHLWAVWRKAEGLPSRDPYVQEYLGHTNITDPEAFTGD